MKRKLPDLHQFKRLVKDQLLHEISQLDPVPQFVKEPYRYQAACFLLGLMNPSILYLLDMGLGKTKITLDVISYRRVVGDGKRTLVFVPNLTNIEAWLDECRIHAPHLTAVGLDGATRAERIEAVFGDADVTIITYQGWGALLGMSKNKGKVVDEGWARKLESLWDFVVLDESTAIKNHRTQAFKAARRLSSVVPYRYALTGTPFGRDPIDLWSQFYFVDRGKALGATLGLFRGAVFTEKPNYWGNKWSKDYKFDKKHEKILRRWMRCSSIRYSAKECLDLPDRVKIKWPVLMPIETKAYYQKVIEELKAAQGNVQLMKNPFTRMRQLASGFMVVTDDDGKRHTIIMDENPKLDELLTLISQIDSRRKIVVWNEFWTSGKLIEDSLGLAGVRYARLYGKTKDKRGALREFLDNPDVRVFISSRAGAHGLNLQEANYTIFYESPVSPIYRSQMEKRTHRIGQERTVFEYDLFTRDSVEEKIIKYLNEGKDLFQSLVEGVEQV